MISLKMRGTGSWAEKFGQWRRRKEIAAAKAIQESGGMGDEERDSPGAYPYLYLFPTGELISPTELRIRRERERKIS